MNKWFAGCGNVNNMKLKELHKKPAKNNTANLNLLCNTLGD